MRRPRRRSQASSRWRGRRHAFADRYSRSIPDSSSPAVDSLTNGQAADQAAVDAALAEMARSGYSVTLVAALGEALFVVLALWPSTKIQTLLAWFALLGLVMLLRTWHMRRPVGADRLGRWRLEYALGTGVAGLVWGFAPVLMIGPSDSLALNFLAFILAGITGATAALHAAQWGAAVAFQTGALVPLALLLASFGGRFHYLLAGTVLIYLAVLAACAWHIHRSLRQNLVAERQRATLASQISQKDQEFASLADNLPDPVIRYDRDCRRVYANALAARIGDKALAELLGKTPIEAPILAPEENRLLMATLRHVLLTGKPIASETAHRPPDGKLHHYQSHFGPEFGPGGEVLGVLLIVHDVTAQKQHEAELRERATLEARLSSLADSIPGFIHTYRVTADGQAAFPFASAGIHDVLGLNPEDVLHSAVPFWQCIHPDDRAPCLNTTLQSRRKLTPLRLEIRYYHPGKGERWIEIRSTPRREADGSTFWHGLIIDVTQRKLTEQALAARETEFRTLAQNLPDIVIRYDCQCRRILVNNSYEKAFPAHAKSQLGMALTQSGLLQLGFEPRDAEDYERRLRQVLGIGQPDSFDVHVASAGEPHIYHVKMTPEYDEEGRVIGVLSIARDVTEARADQQHIHTLAFYDVLTGLPNRALFNEHARRTMLEARRDGERIGLMLLDLDQFKAINDTLGHAVGDRLLLETGKRIKGVLRAVDMVARLGGDEFAIVLPQVRDGSDLGGVAGNLLVALAAPYLLEGHEVFVSASIGIALYPNNGDSFDTLLKYADTALYLAKGRGRNNFQFYSAELTERATERMMLETDLRRSLANGELEVHYQSKVSLQSGVVTGAEALLRWRHSTRGMIPPDRFIHIAEDTGLIVDIGAWVLTQACTLAVEWNHRARSPRRIAVNLSPRQFQGHDLKTSVLDILMRTGCRPEWIELEITEGLLLDNRDDIRATLLELDSLGIQIAIDDFGTGYSALGYLGRFPIHTLKIDRSFVSHIPGEGGNTALVQAVLAMAHSLDLDVVAEGVETKEQAQWLKEAGCEQGQGYLWSKPLPTRVFRQRFISQEVAASCT